MAKLGLLTTSTVFIATIIGAFTFATMTDPPSADAADKCQRSDHKTKLVKEACEKGGQKAAKDAMKVWMKEKKLKSCNQCHSKLAPTYALKADAVEQFAKLGGELLPGVKAGAPAKTAPTKTAPAKPAPTK